MRSVADGRLCLAGLGGAPSGRRRRRGSRLSVSGKGPRSLRAAALVALSLLAGACDSGPSGPGELTGTVQTPGPTLGGAVVEVVGKGITGFSGAGSTRVFHAATGEADTYRLILIREAPGELQFRVSVEDLGGKRPVGSVVDVVTGDNLPIPATPEYRVGFTR